MRCSSHVVSSLVLAVLVPSVTPIAGQVVNESARQIPVAYEVDVVVVGGGTGAVSAAVTAASEGAKVFLAAPHPYLGEDMTATLQLWLEEGETPKAPLARRLYADPFSSGADPNRLEFDYQADAPSNPKHKDYSPPRVLTDQQWSDAVTESVQFDQDVTVVAELNQIQDVRGARVMFFRRRKDTSAGSGFDVQQVSVSVSDDKRTWKNVGVAQNDLPFDDIGVLSVTFRQPARYVRLEIQKPESFDRMLLGEIEIIGPDRQNDGERALTPPPRPMHVKKTLDDVLLEADVQFLYSCYATDVLHDADLAPCGIVMANRAGRQAVIAKTIVDATPRAVVARMAGARFRDYPTGTRVVKRVVIGGEPQSADATAVRRISPPFTTHRGTFPILEYALSVDFTDDTYAAYMRADQKTRNVTYDPEQQYTSDVLWDVPPDPMSSREPLKRSWQSVDDLPLGVFQPKDVDRLYILGGCADVSRTDAKRLIRPLAQIDIGRRIGQTSARLAKSLPPPSGVQLVGTVADEPVAAGDVNELLTGVRPTQRSTTVPQPSRSLPVLGRYDVVVIGGGTGGAPAGIAAARQGAKTLVVEYLHGLGGVGTLGGIASYYWGNRVGFTASVQDGVTRWKVEPKMQWFRKQLLDAGGEVWFGTIGCGVFMEDNRVRGAVVATPYGRGVVLAHTVIDATGNSDVAAAAGAETLYTDASEFGMQGTGLPGRKLGGAYNNTDFTIVDETDMVDVWHVYVYAKDKYPEAFDQGRLIDTRERRRIVGDVVINLTDQINQRKYRDSVVRCWTNFDSHGYTIDPYLLLEHPEKVGIGVYVPYRAMLPQGIEGMLVIGLGISAHRDAVPLIRMQADIQNGGYAAGTAAAMASASGELARYIDIDKLQRHLVQVGNLPDSTITDRDTYPLSDEQFAEAIETLPEGRGAAVLMTDPERAIPQLKSAYANASGKEQLAYAKALAVLGSDAGLNDLLDQVRNTSQWDQGWNYRGMGQFGAALSHLDAQIIALGRAGNPQAIPVIVEKLRLLDAETDFSHHRAIGLALELIGDASAARPLAELLAKPGMMGHVHEDVSKARERGVPGGINAVTSRRESLRELMLARALYRCGDHNGLGEKILRQYTSDLRGHLARHAHAVLAEGT